MTGLQVLSSTCEKSACYASYYFLASDTRWRQAAKEEAAGEEGKKKKGGVSIPEEWPWEEAKKIFEKPDVIPADDVEVSMYGSLVRLFLFTRNLVGELGIAGMEGTRCGQSRPVSRHGERFQVSKNANFLSGITDMFNSEERVRKGAEKLTKFLNAKQQGRLDGFFTVQAKTSPKKDAAKGKKGGGKGKDKDKPAGKRKVGLRFERFSWSNPGWPSAERREGGGEQQKVKVEVIYFDGYPGVLSTCTAICIIELYRFNFSIYTSVVAHIVEGTG
jgi:hypothetical protein